MTTVTEAKRTIPVAKAVPWLPLAILPVVAGFSAVHLPAWGFMWALAFAVYAGLKWLTFADSSHASSVSLWQKAGYLVLWPGLHSEEFFDTRANVARPATGEWGPAIFKTLFGVFLVIWGAPAWAEKRPLVAGAIGMTGLLFALHFGLFHVLSLAWRTAGINARPLMQAPWRSASLSEFWGRRWNLAFRDAAHHYVFRPLAPRIGMTGATMAVFAVSGLIHDAVVSFPAGAGWGLPTLYFVVQGWGILAERSRTGRRIGLGRGLMGGSFCFVVAAGPVLLLFHPWFLEGVIVPMLRTISLT